MMFADPEDIKADLIGKLDLLNQVSQPLRRGKRAPGGGIRRILDERVDTEFHRNLLTWLRGRRE
jgi:hypothetical protein